MNYESSTVLQLRSVHILYVLREGHCVGPLGHVVTRASLKLRENLFMSIAGTSLTDLIPEETNE